MVKIIGLLENTTEKANLKNKHGLSVYIETDKQKILFDMGPNDLFIKNATALGIDIADIDVAVISHGHVDHCGGLKSFLKVNKKAKIYLRPQAAEEHFVKVLGIPFYAGINRQLVQGDRFVFTDDLSVVNDEITLFSNVRRNFKLPKSDSNLFVKKNGRIVSDDFNHEQNLILTSGGKKLLVCGCAHSGIVNILDKAKEIIGDFPDTVVGGFHLYEPTSKRYESDEYIDSVASNLEMRKAEYYTCHCTGQKACLKMEKRLGGRLNYLHTGTEFILFE